MVSVLPRRSYQPTAYLFLMNLQRVATLHLQLWMETYASQLTVPDLEDHLIMTIAPRPVCNLTSAQLERKRAQDRLAQRATRERTREHIRRLEQAVYELRVRTAAESNGVDPNSLQELHLRNQALREELARLRGLAAAERGVSSVHQPGDPEMNPAPPSPFTQLSDTEMQSQSPSQARDTYQCCVGDSALFFQHSPDSHEPNAQAAHANHMTAAEQQPEWLALSLWNSSVMRFNLSGSSRPSQIAQQHALSCPQSFGCTCTKD
ncbi:hypothetical protein VFPPC_12344 [Pochonia chlamydosporia 170]|uniref:BZIP domain-containing protein n=1 Tax=Pochonia chlamydosporia 170 TaxID=1380566 RepID=A0A179EWY3_METCM|nr:hypothetical protein VFPPC_12344 [Pochonia chlamydosporia 170]OAQ57530.2 hypothetical protein VFPPC_12344 [Pochonia chlamydosporia 170]